MNGEQSQHRLTHLPFKSWCPSCLAHRARSDKHERSGESHSGPVPTISFDFFFTKSDGKDAKGDEPNKITSLIVVDSHTSFVACVPLEGKAQLDHANREVIKFVQMLGYSEIILHCDNEPAILQLKRLVLKTRQSMALKTRESSTVAYDKSNSLAENAIGRVRPLACSLMHQLHGRLGIQLPTTSAIWTWSLRHAAWLISRYSVIRGATPHELAFGRTYNGELCEFGEPVFAYVVPNTKASARWKRMLFLGKADTQNSYVLFDGQAIVMSKSVRRITTTWRSHMAYYLHCKCFSWQFRSGFGPRVLPTMKKAVPKAVSFEMPLEPIEENKLHDKDAEAVIEYSEKEKQAEEEQLAIASQELQAMVPQQSEVSGSAPSGSVPEDAPAVPMSSAPMNVEAPAGSVPSAGHAGGDGDAEDPGLAVPVTPPRDFVMVEPLSDAEADVSRGQRTEDAKRQRISRLKVEYEKRLSEVKLAYKEYFTVDDYTTDLDLEEEDNEDVWAGEDDVKLQGIPMELWSDHPIDQQPPFPDRWIDDLADKVEIQRLREMEVLVLATECQDDPTGKLTTKFVRDWRLKSFSDDNGERKKWMRRSRLVAREFANSKRLDTFSPATGAHVSNILPLKYLWMKSGVAGMETKEEYDTVLASLDVRDAFLQVDQDNPVLVKLQGENWVIKKNLPGQRLGAKQWFQYLRNHLQETMDFEFSMEQPCMARTKECTIIIHVDDILFVGLKTFWKDVFLPNMSQKFSISHDQLQGNGTSIKFLRRTITEVPEGLVLSPGTSVAKVVQSFEQHFGTARAQKIPCDSSLQLVDNSQKLDDKDASNFRSVVGLCLYVGRERPDLMFAIKELAAVMACPTVVSLQHLRKLIGFMKHVGDVGVLLRFPQPGMGKFHAGGDQEFVLESFSDADWSSNKSHRRSTSCGMHMINGAFMYGSSRSQKVVSLSSCESELHALVSCACDGIFIKACAEFAFNAKFLHVVFTDSSSARQLACRQGSGRIRHLSGKILWIQEKTQDGSLELRQIGTLDNLADIATKCLSKQRLFLLMNETGLVFIPTFEAVGAEEASRHHERVGNTKQLKKVAKAVLQMSIAMGLEPWRAVGVAAQKCSLETEPQVNLPWTYSWIFLACMVVIFMLVGWRFAMRKFSTLEWKVSQLEREMGYAQQQLADHYEYDADLGTRLDTLEGRTEYRDEALEGVTARLAVLEEDSLEGISGLEAHIESVRYGLMELGGFVRYTLLTRDQRQSMFTQERANFVMWSQRTHAETTDEITVPQQFRETPEEAEEETPTDDEVATVAESPGSATTLLENLRLDQNIALAGERWTEASELQRAIMCLLEPTTGAEPEGMSRDSLTPGTGCSGLSPRVVMTIRNVCQRLYRWHRNRGFR